MASPYGPLRLIVNPRAGRGAVAQHLPAVEEVLRSEELEFDVVETKTPGHARELARAAVEDGRFFVVAVGGDGTLHEVVNGLMGEEGPIVPELVIGMVPSGSGCDFARTFGLPQDTLDAARALGGKNLWGALDIGRVRYRGADGSEQKRWFVNIAEAGIGADVVVSAAKMPRRFGGRAYRLAALKAIVQFKPVDGHLDMNARKGRGVRPDTPLEPMSHAGRLTMVVVANCQFYGGGLRVAPRAIPSDGKFDVLVGEGTKWDCLRALQKMPRGEHVPSSVFTEYLADKVSLDGMAPLQLEVDGEPIGTTPAVFDLVPAAIRLKV
jgi:diacylglycerol kinase (ATP)